MDKRKTNGGARSGAGRKPKAEEQQLIEKLSPLSKVAYKALKSSIEENEGWAVKLYFEYMYGKPKQSIDQTVKGEFEINFKD
tara:strand:- start:184 stop:429 length:246 start_codon:yes stop_codon:yes gene_type:complete